MSKDLRNLFIAILLSSLVLVAWQYFYENPKRAKIDLTQQQHKKAGVEKAINQKFLSDNMTTSEEAGFVTIDTSMVKGSIALKGLRFNDLELKAYHKEIGENSPLVRLFSSEYFTEFGWIRSEDNEDLAVPTKNSVWVCNGNELVEAHPIYCSWHNQQGVFYNVKISIDENYLFTIVQTVENNSKQTVSLSAYGRIYKAIAEPKQFAILHEGAIGVFSDVLKESTYEDLSKERQEIYTNTNGSWAGFTNKYWLAALIPDSNLPSKTNFIATKNSNHDNAHDSYNVNYVSKDFEVSPGDKFQTEQHLFAGAKEEKLLESYSKTKNFDLFDRAIDYGIFYFITKPLLILINYFNSIMGNFGLAILLVTLTLKLLMYPLANKSYISMNKMKDLQPKIEKIKARFADDKVKFNQEIMDLYKKEKVNPAAGCLPLLIQIPLFFSLYKVIFISIEMRHAPFYGWIKDLSAADPTTIWNLFGLLPWGPIGMVDIGLWPIIMGVTMFIQQKLSPAPTDQVQAAVMKFMPLVLIVMLYSLPSGLMIYWSFSNILSILQQYLISKKASVK
ncbi:MAG: membrane protein insertase YidC [Pseudomonadota bacterium]